MKTEEKKIVANAKKDLYLERNTKTDVIKTYNL